MEKDTKELTLSLEPGPFINSFQYLIQLWVQNMFQMITTMPFSLTSILLIYLGQGIHFLFLSLFCLYDWQYWVEIIMEVFNWKFGCEGQFIHPKLPTPSLKWPSRDDLCWVPNAHVCRVVSPPELSSQTTRM